MFNAQNVATTLDELCRVLNDENGRLVDCSVAYDQSPGTAKRLPTWGVAPPDVSGIWSWDATRVLFADRNGKFYIEPRDPEAWYPNEKGPILP
jgi:hypothetical protein